VASSGKRLGHEVGSGAPPLLGVEAIISFLLSEKG
jgi:hypothetical protein